MPAAKTTPATPATPTGPAHGVRWALGTGLALLILLGVDASLPPRYQVMGHVAMWTISGYQLVGRPITKSSRIVCRYTQSCSDYSYEMFETRGFWPGLKLSAVRVSRCSGDVPPGTVYVP